MISKNWIEANKQVDKWKSTGLKVVFTNGCFDILHRGHVEYLTDAKACGDKLETCPVCHKQMLSHDLAQVNQCMKDFIKKLCGKTQFDT
ncbi:MAG TPA: hypothetical protein EYO86_05000, partial [Pelagibacterales bacterium]|nr:hypothetical protein [Pelagibacterales bacterium]